MGETMVIFGHRPTVGPNASLPNRAAPCMRAIRPTPYPKAPTSCVIAVAISRTIPNNTRIGAKISSCSRV